MLVGEAAMGEVVVGLVCGVAGLVCSSWSMGKGLCELAGSVGTAGYDRGHLVQVWLVCWVCKSCSWDVCTGLGKQEREPGWPNAWMNEKRGACALAGHARERRKRASKPGLVLVAAVRACFGP